MKEITIIKNSRATETLRATELHVLAETIRSGEYQKEVNNLRTYYPLMSKERNEDGTLAGAEEQTRRLPRLCFASLLENRNQQRVMKAYTGMVLLEVDNLQSYEEAAAVRNGAALMPQTLMAFVGANGLSVEIICSGMLTTASEEALPQNADDIRTFHLNLYEKARLVYNGQLGVTIEKLEPHLDRVCYMSTDRELFYNPAATPFYIELTTVDKAVGSKAATTIEARETAPGLDRYLTLHKIFEFNLMKAYDEMDTDEMFDAGDGQQQNEDELYTHLLAIRLASKCQQTGIPMSIALRMARAHSIFRKDMMLLRLVFENAYRKTNEKKYRSRKAISNPLKNIAPETLLTMKIDIFLREHYELRKNVMRGVAEYRQRSGLGFSFQDLTEEARNSMTMRALEQGIRCWDKDIRRFVNSDDIELYDPIGDWLEHLPRWDGKDRVTPLAQRVKTDYEEWTHLFHLWIRSMVAM